MSGYNVISFLGLFVLMFLAWLMSEDRQRFPWRVVIWGISLQIVFGFVVLFWEPGAKFFLKLNDVFNALLAFSEEGATFVFNSVGSSASTGHIPLTLKEYLTRLGQTSTDPLIQLAIKTGTVPGFFFAFQVLTTIIFFSALLSVLYYLGIMQKIVLLFAKIMERTMRVSGAESLSNSANIFVGQTEAPLVVRPYIESMTRSELMAIMVGGFANTAGGVLGAYVMMLSGYFPNIASHLISASLLSAPAAFIFAKIMVPEKESPLTMGEVKMEVEIQDANVLDAAANGTTVGWQLAINVAAMLVSFVALIAMANLGVSAIGDLLHNRMGVIRFDLMLGAAVLALLIVWKRGRAPNDVLVWSMLAGVAVLAAVSYAAMDNTTAKLITGVAISAWFPLFLQCDRPKPFGPPLLLTLIAIGVIANVGVLMAGPLAPDTKLSLQLILGWFHWPIAVMMGVPPQDALSIGKLLGEKLILTEFIAYIDLSNILGAVGRGEMPALDPRSIVIVSYALCGFSNFASIAIQIGGIAPMAPSRRGDLAKLGFKAMVAGSLATYMIACVAGMFYNGPSMLGIAPSP